MRVVIRAELVAAALGNGFGAFHHQGAAGLSVFVIANEIADAAGRFGFDGMFALGIIGTAVKNTETTFSFRHFSILAKRAFDTGGRSGRALFFLNVFAFRVLGAGNKLAEFSVSLYKFIVAFRAVFTRFFRTFQLVSLHRPRSGTLGKGGAAVKFSRSTKLDNHFLPANGAENIFGSILKCVYFFH